MEEERKVAIEVKNVGVRFNLSKEKLDSLKEFVLRRVQGKIEYNEFWAVQDVSFTVYEGDRIGILGLNGAGKSTLLKVIAGVFKPTEGSVRRNGIIAPLLELGAGFEPQYTARENIYLYAAVLGYSKRFIDEKFDEIVEFSELEEFLDVPLKNYSSGMKSRLGFAICTAVNPDILILDEVLSVGDAQFRKKSEKRIQDMFDRGITVLFVSHSLEQVRRICNRALILEEGRLRAIGDVKTVGDEYETVIEEKRQIRRLKKKTKKERRKARKAAKQELEKINNGVDGDKPAVQDAAGSEKASDIGGGVVPAETDIPRDSQ